MSLPIVMIPVYTRLYSPEEYSRWGVFSSIILIFGIIQGLSSDLTIVKFKERKEVKTFFKSGVSWFVLVSLLFATILLIQKKVLNRIDITYVEIFLISVAVLSTGISALTRGYLNFHRRYKIIATSVVAVSFIQAASRVSLALIDNGVFNSNLLLVSYVLAQFVGMIYLFPMDSARNIGFSLKQFFIGLNNFSELAVFQTISRLLELGSLHLVLILLTNFYSSTQVGYYTMSLQLALLPAALIGGAMGTVLYKELIVQKEDASAMESIRSSLQLIFILSIIFGLSFHFGIGKLIIYILGEQWNNSLPTFRVLIGMALPIIISQPLNYVFKAFDRMVLKLVLNIFMFIVPLSILTWNLLSGADYYLAIKFYGLSMSICCSAVILWAIYILKINKELKFQVYFILQLMVSLLLVLG